MFPRAVWPGELPGTIPISVSFEGEYKYQPRKGEHSDFSALAGEVEIISSGTMGEVISWFGAVEFESKNLTGEAEVSAGFDAITGPDGRYTFEWVPPGIYKVYWQPVGLQSWVRLRKMVPDVVVKAGETVGFQDIETNLPAVVTNEN